MRAPLSHDGAFQNSTTDVLSTSSVSTFSGFPGELAVKKYKNGPTVKDGIPITNLTNQAL